ncbi:MAG: UDP-N-acetylmuramate--L-alanine ligase [Nocardioides sp.]
MRVPVPDEITDCRALGRVHFVGIGGAGLSAIARIMLARGIAVSGSDGRDSPTLGALRQAGAQVYVGHRRELVHHCDTVVVSTAVPADNPEVVEAIRLGLRLWPRSAALASVMAGQRVLAVAGTHGKTTTTSLLACALAAAGADPAFAIGGDLTQRGTNAADGSGSYFVAEADESDGAFLVYSPFAAIVTNVEADHLDHYGTEAAYRRAFDEFAGLVDPAGTLVCVVDDPGARALAEVTANRAASVLRVGTAPDAELRAARIRFAGRTSTFVVERRSDSPHRSGHLTPIGEITLQIPGQHYVLDALAALGLGLWLGFDFDGLKRGLEGFTGTHRRMESKGEAGGVRVYDSYAHHPREIAADLAAARAIADGGRVLVAFQPHLVSRTRIFAVEMGQALNAADYVLVLDIYLARESADPAVSGQLIVDAAIPDRAFFEPDATLVPARLVTESRAGDLILTLGAGDVTELGEPILRLLESHAGGASGDH